MSKERESLLKLHELIVKKRENPPTTFSPLQPPNSVDNTQSGKGIDYGRLSGLISGDGKTNGKTE